jgi:hypothetical protein
MWDIAAVRTGNGATRNLVIPNIITITDTNTGAYYTNVEAGAATTITGTGDTLIVQVSRDYTTDTLDAAARLLSLRLTPVI